MSKSSSSDGDNKSGSNKRIESNFVRGKLDILTEFIDRNIRVYRLIPSVVTTGTVIFLAYYFHIPIRRITRVSQLKPLIVRNRTLSGVVQSSCRDSLNVWHVPRWRWILRVGREPPETCPQNNLLKVFFSGVVIEDQAAVLAWLKQIVGKKVWFKPLICKGDGGVYCIVHYKKPGMIGGKVCVNTELLKLGMASVSKIHGVMSNSDYAKLTSGLLLTEKSAKERGIGVWKGTDHVTLWNRFKSFLKKS